MPSKRENAAEFCDTVLKQKPELTLYDLFDSDLEARDIYTKRIMARVWEELDALQVENVNGLTHLKKELSNQIDRMKKQPEVVSEPQSPGNKTVSTGTSSLSDDKLTMQIKLLC